MKILDYVPPVSSHFSYSGNRTKVDAPRDDKNNFDTITLQHTNLSAEQSFTLETIGRVAQEVRAATTTGDIQSLRDRITAGQYQIDADAIARRILLQPRGTDV